MISFKNDTSFVLYDEFISKWSFIINKSFSTERYFCIHIITLEQLHKNYGYLIKCSYENYDDSPYGCIYDAGFEDQVSNVIIVNVEFLNKLRFTSDECMACVLHEVGHLYYYLEYSKVGGNNISIKELMSDCFVKSLGAGNDLKSALTKLTQSGLFTKEYCEGAIDWRIDRL